ncbi:hypothetical protein EYZ11_005419 [Aspergillus tanneri]|uniref:Uncharacterized protein n=1 Tax=Aspergillus tanneri TaxID=1220188 RepID=A0A4S3JIL0_9EURO|nr:hypothetical protein EYZ11_005419 [Aspergillus tanneri]
MSAGKSPRTTTQKLTCKLLCIRSSFPLLQRIPIAFHEVSGTEPQIAALPFLGLAIDIVIAVCCIIYYTLTIYKHQVGSNPGAILPVSTPMIIMGAALLPSGMFWTAWTCHISTLWPVQVAAYIVVGAALFIVSVQGFKYLVDVYLNVVNSAISGNSFARSFFGAGFPLFSTALYHNLGLLWMTSLLRFIALALAPVPVLYFIYGKKIRSFSKNALAV